MRRQYTWLAELLDPSVPVRYLLTGEEPDTATSFGPPRLSTIAAKVLHEKLIGELQAIKAQAARAAAAEVATEDGGAGAVGAAAAAAVSVPNSLQVAQAGERAAAAAVARDTRRWWSLSGARRSSNGGSISSGSGGGAAPPPNTETASNEAAVAAASSVTAPPPAAAAPPPAAGSGTRSSALSPRVISSSIPEEQAPTANALGGNSVSHRTPTATAFARVSLSASTTPRSLLNGHKGVDGPASPQSPRGDTPVTPGRVTVRVGLSELEVDPQGAVSGGGDSSAPSAPSSPHGSEGGGADVMQEKVSPHPELLEEGPHAGPSVLNGLLRTLRRSTSHRIAPTGHRCSLSSEDGVTCGICLDALPATCIEPCKHVMCGKCC